MADDFQNKNVALVAGIITFTVFVLGIIGILYNF